MRIPYFWENSGHAETAWRALASRASLPWQPERIATPDHDFLDLFWYENDAMATAKDGLVVYCHGLAGHAQSTYIALTVQALQQKLPWPSLAWNYRSCSAEINKQPRFYHLGETEDLRTVLQHARHRGYKRFLLVGFSAGGSIVLNLPGKHPAEALALGVVGAAAISTPLDLEGCARQLETPGSLFYNHRFCKALAAKVLEKAKRMGPGFPLSVHGLEKIRTLRTFDDAITAPLHGFASAAAYYQQCSALALLPALPVPVVLWAAQNDPFLAASCFPTATVLAQSPQVHAVFPDRGGHCGFALCTGQALHPLIKQVCK